MRRVADVSIREGEAQLVRENLKPMVATTARIEGRDLGSTLRNVQAAVGRMRWPAGVYVEYGGLYREQQQSLWDLALVFVSAVLLVTVLILFLYERLVIVVSMLTTMLISSSGVFSGLWLTGADLDISAMMGLTMIVGIVTEVAIFYFAELGTAPLSRTALIRFTPGGCGCGRS